ncbi:hypothetical protein [Pigmentiphaga litoralis]|uniref:hypothetical protein n=1 Tax=Pigmentiphaga litoralis TaxID=516702 RepID=UPI003B437DF6
MSAFGLNPDLRIDPQDDAPASASRRRAAFALIGLALAGMGVPQRNAFATGGLPVKLTSGGRDRPKRWRRPCSRRCPT